MTLQTCHLDIDPTLPGERKGIQERFDEIQKEVDCKFNCLTFFYKTPVLVLSSHLVWRFITMYPSWVIIHPILYPTNVLIR